MKLFENKEYCKPKSPCKTKGCFDKMAHAINKASLAKNTPNKTQRTITHEKLSINFNVDFYNTGPLTVQKFEMSQIQT